jgi:hypothetical protein
MLRAKVAISVPRRVDALGAPIAEGRNWQGGQSRHRAARSSIRHPLLGAQWAHDPSVFQEHLI